MKIIDTKDAPAAIGPYSQAIEAGNFVYTSGQIPIVPETGEFVAGGIKEQTEQVIKNLSAVLSEAKTGLKNVVKTTCFLAKMSDFGEFNAVYEQFFSHKPVRSCIQAAALPKGALVEIEVVAIKEGAGL